jgi:hypothetical protein
MGNDNTGINNIGMIDIENIDCAKTLRYRKNPPLGIRIRPFFVDILGTQATSEILF